MLFPSRNDNTRVQHSVKSPPAQPKDLVKGANSCVKMILHAPSQLVFPNLSLMKL